MREAMWKVASRRSDPRETREAWRKGVAWFWEICFRHYILRFF